MVAIDRSLALRRMSRYLPTRTFLSKSFWPRSWNVGRLRASSDRGERPEAARRDTHHVSASHHVPSHSARTGWWAPRRRSRVQRCAHHQTQQQRACRWRPPRSRPTSGHRRCHSRRGDASRFSRRSRTPPWDSRTSGSTGSTAGRTVSSDGRSAGKISTATFRTATSACPARATRACSSG